MAVGLVPLHGFIIFLDLRLFALSSVANSEVEVQVLQMDGRRGGKISSY
jgi:hypothetical protein